MKIILASGSPRRQMLLRELGWNITVKVPVTEETAVPGESPEEMVCRLAYTKAFSVFNESPGCWVIGADTVVATEENILGKPSGPEDAVNMIKMLEGNTHTVVTGVALIAPDGRKLVEAEKTKPPVMSLRRKVQGRTGSKVEPVLPVRVQRVTVSVAR